MAFATEKMINRSILYSWVMSKYINRLFFVDKKTFFYFGRMQTFLLDKWWLKWELTLRTSLRVHMAELVCLPSLTFVGIFISYLVVVKYPIKIHLGIYWGCVHIGIGNSNPSNILGPHWLALNLQPMICRIRFEIQ